MESESEMAKIPCFDLKALEEGSEEWKEMSKKMREACESYGCFLLMWDELIPKGEFEEMFNGMKLLFDLPEQTKQQHISLKPYSSYSGKSPAAPLLQSFGIDNVPLSAASAETFTNLMWPQGNLPFCETLKSMSSKMLELNFQVLKMIVEGYGLLQHYMSEVENMKSCSNSRLMRYKFPERLQVLSKTGKWIELEIPQNVFVAIVGDMLKAWSNGRLHAATHRVVMRGEKDRYSFGVFAMPMEDMDVDVPLELVDEKIHLLRYHPFKSGEYMLL
ncbi:hypothetical protein VNO78_00962 [Psophocarpus tetragonolobus]|uniref:Uncharacterized protein n=1 Tax=Psophocarpus tetragonolobus TaxID=3891 RepID=A0AAN9SZY2_PSOTE